jgi:hypothetical protein
MVKKSGDYEPLAISSFHANSGVESVIEPTVEHDDPVEKRLDRIEATLARILSHLDPAGTSVTLNPMVESEGQ